GNEPDPSDELDFNDGPPPEDTPVDRAYDDYRRRLEAGEQIDEAEFCAAYPEMEDSLHRLISVHGQRELREYPVEEPDPVWPSVGDHYFGFHLGRALAAGGL